MLKADGTKFGKTAGGAIWLDPEKTSPFEFYQFWLNQEDADVVRYLKYFTFLNQDEIAALAGAVREEPEKRLAQRRLAEEVTAFVHGDTALKEAENITEALYHGDIADLSKRELEQAFGKMPTVTVGAEAKNIVDWLVDALPVPNTSCNWLGSTPKYHKMPARISAPMLLPPITNPRLPEVFTRSSSRGTSGLKVMDSIFPCQPPQTPPIKPA